MTLRRLEYAPRYFRRLEDIHERIAAENPTAASRMIERIRSVVARVAASPALGRPGRVAGTRELVISGTPYIVPYRVVGDVVQIITILHGAQRWPERCLKRHGTAGCCAFWKDAISDFWGWPSSGIAYSVRSRMGNRKCCGVGEI